MGWLWLVGSTKLLVSFAKVPYKRDGILQKRPIIVGYYVQRLIIVGYYVILRTHSTSEPRSLLMISFLLVCF